MKFKIEDKAKKYIDDENIKNLLVKIDSESRDACCGLGNIDFLIDKNISKKPKGFKSYSKEKIEIFYDPNLEFYFKEDDEVIIGTFKFLKFRKLLIKNEIDVLK